MSPTTRSIVAMLCASALACALGLSALAAFAAPPASSEPTATTVDEATRQAIELENQIQAARDDAGAIERHIEVTNNRIFNQQWVLTRTEADLAKAKAVYSGRLVELYKGTAFDPVILLLGATSLSDLYERIVLLGRVVDRDRRAYEDAQLAATQAAYEANRLDELKAELVDLRRLRAQRVHELEDALVRQRALVRTLSKSGRSSLERVRITNRMSRRQWRASSIPVGNLIPIVEVTVEPHAEPYLAPEYQPDYYRVVGQPFTVVCSWYGNEFNGKPAASGQIYNQDDFTCASRTLPFGTRLALQRGSRRIVVVVTDRGPFVPGRDLDLSKAAAEALGYSGVAALTAEICEEATPPSQLTTVAP